jgi:4-hydroxy-tetrahydrodipicolinate reductase
MNNTILLIGNGKLSKSLQPLLKNYIVFVFDENNITELKKYQGSILIDCSLNKAFNYIYDYLKIFPTKTIICSTGHSKRQINQMNELSNSMPIFKSENFSLGIALINKFIKDNKKIIDRYDNYIFDFHHKNKIDSPSGTSKLLMSSFSKSPNVFSIRSSNIIGAHKINLFQEDEEIEISHKITSRDIFAKGIILSIDFILNKEKGIFSMEDILNEI